MKATIGIRRLGEQTLYYAAVAVRDNARLLTWDLELLAHAGVRPRRIGSQSTAEDSMPRTLERSRPTREP